MHSAGVAHEAAQRVDPRAGLNEREVPRTTTLSGTTFQVSPPWIWPRVRRDQ